MEKQINIAGITKEFLNFGYYFSNLLYMLLKFSCNLHFISGMTLKRVNNG